MKTNIRGWRARQAAARMRQAGMSDRMKINAIRRAHYDRMERGVEPLQESVHEPEVDASAPPAQEPAPEPVQEAKAPEDMSNADLRAALEGKGLEVPKTTARTRLIDLYKEHVL